VSWVPKEGTKADDPSGWLLMPLRLYAGGGTWACRGWSSREALIRCKGNYSLGCAFWPLGPGCGFGLWSIIPAVNARTMAKRGGCENGRGTHRRVQLGGNQRTRLIT